MLVPRRRTQVVSTVAAPAEVLGQLVMVHQWSWQVVVILRSVQYTASVAIVPALHTIERAQRSHQRRQRIYVVHQAATRTLAGAGCPGVVVAKHSELLKWVWWQTVSGPSRTTVVKRNAD